MRFFEPSICIGNDCLRACAAIPRDAVAIPAPDLQIQHVVAMRLKSRRHVRARTIVEGDPAAHRASTLPVQRPTTDSRFSNVVLPGKFGGGLNRIRRRT